MQKYVTFVERESEKSSLKLCYWKFRDFYHYIGKYRDAARRICNLKFNEPHEIPVVFHNGSNYDYHFIIKEFPNEFEGKFECL